MGKRLFDVVLALMGLAFLWWLIALGWILAAISTRSNGFFFQERIGRNAQLFKIVKLKTMGLDKTGDRSSVTVISSASITRVGKYLRKFKIDELPQLFNVLVGQMSFVGPRPDVPGYADKLTGEDRLILELRPGITGPASLKYKDEEIILKNQKNPVEYNDKIIWPDKVRINLQYYYSQTLMGDVKLIIKTLLG